MSSLDSEFNVLGLQIGDKVRILDGTGIGKIAEVHGGHSTMSACNVRIPGFTHPVGKYFKSVERLYAKSYDPEQQPFDEGDI
jgi:hypothetical protein